MRTDGVLDALPDTVGLRLRFQAAPALSAAPSEPDLARVVPGPGAWASDPSILNAAPHNPELRFLRFEVPFALDAAKQGLGTPTPALTLESLRFPFRFGSAR